MKKTMLVIPAILLAAAIVTTAVFANSGAVVKLVETGEQSCSRASDSITSKADLTAALEGGPCVIYNLLDTETPGEFSLDGVPRAGIRGENLLLIYRIENGRVFLSDGENDTITMGEAEFWDKWKKSGSEKLEDFRIDNSDLTISEIQDFQLRRLLSFESGVSIFGDDGVGKSKTELLTYLLTETGEKYTQMEHYLVEGYLRNGSNGNFSLNGVLYSGFAGENLLFLYEANDSEVVLLDGRMTEIRLPRAEFFKKADKFKEKLNKDKCRAYRIINARLEVPLIQQLPELPSGCEITAWTMMASYAGGNISKTEAAAEMPRARFNPDEGFVGDPTLNDGWTIYPPALMEMTEKYCGGAVNISGKGEAGIKGQLAKGSPVVAWVCGLDSGGVRFVVHAITMTGFDEKGWYYSDPWTGESGLYIKKAEFLRVWDDNFKAEWGAGQLAISY